MTYKELKGSGLKGGSTWASERREGRSCEIWVWVLVPHLGSRPHILVLVPFNLRSCGSGGQSSFSPEVRIQFSRPDWVLCLDKDRRIFLIMLAVGTPDGGLLIILRVGRKRQLEESYLPLLWPDVSCGAEKLGTSKWPFRKCEMALLWSTSRLTTSLVRINDLTWLAATNCNLSMILNDGLLTSKSKMSAVIELAKTV